MNQKLDNFINDNRDEFDDKLPSGNTWKNVEAAMAGKKEQRFILTPFLKWSIAAAVLFFVGSGIYFIVKKDDTGKHGLIETKSDIPDAPPEMNQFTVLIAMKQEELKTLSKGQPQLYEQFTSVITQLDSSYRSLKNQLSVTPNREVLLEAMIQNLQLQLNESHEKNDQAI